jgi:PilZ domain
MSHERRRSPRVEILGRVSGRLLPPGTRVVVREMSLGGLALETAFPFEPGTVQALQLTLGDGAAVDLLARVMHCRTMAPEGGEPLFLTGLQFIDDDADGPPVVGEIIDKLT